MIQIRRSLIIEWIGAVFLILIVIQIIVIQIVIVKIISTKRERKTILPARKISYPQEVRKATRVMDGCIPLFEKIMRKCIEENVYKLSGEMVYEGTTSYKITRQGHCIELAIARSDIPVSSLFCSNERIPL